MTSIKNSTTVSGNMSTLALENKLKQLKESSNTVSTQLTQKLASSRSGQDLLHIGTSLSSLPPDLHLLQTELQPMVVAAEEMESTLKKEIESLVSIQGTQVQFQQSRISQAQECADLYQDLVAAELQVENERKRKNENEVEKEEYEDLDLALGLERAALTAVCLIDQVKTSTERISSMTSQNNNSTTTTESTEQAQFILKLAPRIRTLETNVISCLTIRLEKLLQSVQTNNKECSSREDLLMFGHCMRGLAVLGRGKDVESVFARVAIMPCIRSKVSMGTLDQGGGRGECAGLPALLDEVASTITTSYGSILQLSEAMALSGVDLVTEGVWVPIATTLMADQGIKMAIFSPGIASVLQANYSALDSFLSKLATRLLQDTKEEDPQEKKQVTCLQDLYFQPNLTPDMIQKAQQRIYRHAITSDFSKKWNLPIYYQLRFGETCKRLNTAMDSVQVGQGWETSMVFTGSPSDAERMRDTMGLELPVFMELYDILLCLWKPDVIIRPLSHRFLRGAVQLVGRMIVFCQDGLDKKIQFGQEPEQTEQDGEAANGVMNGDSSSTTTVVREPYYWAENPRDVAVVAWDLTVLGTSLAHDYVDIVCEAISEDSANKDEIRQLVSQVLTEAAEPIGKLVGKCWNTVIVDILTSKCCGPLAAVKGVGATYRMTNRPPPTKASPFVSMVLRPLSEFVTEFDNRTPPHVGSNWKVAVISTVALRYSVAVEELLATVERTEVALRNRRARRGVSSGGMSDGEKVKLQLYLDYKEFSSNVESLIGSTAALSIEGLVKLSKLTVVEAEG